MITGSEFEKALTTIATYRAQLEYNLNQYIKDNNREIDIQNDLKASTFVVLQKYYLNEYDIVLEYHHLTAMKVGLLELINYKKLEKYRGFGKRRLYDFRKLMISHSVIDWSEL